MRFVTVLFFALLWGQNYAQQGGFYEVTYTKYSNGNIIGNQDPILLRANKNEALLSSVNQSAGKKELPFELSWFEYEKPNHIHSVAYMKDNQVIATLDSTGSKSYVFEITGETKKILGFNCKKALTKVNSNNIVLWFTNDIKIYGGPTTLGSHLGLILEYERNNSFVISADEVKFHEKLRLLVINEFRNLTYYPVLDYRDLLWKSRFTSIPVFKGQIINFDPDRIENDLELKVSFASGTIVARKIKFPEIPQGHHLFVDANIQSNGDAYDRTASIVAIPINNRKSMLNALQEGLAVLPIYSNGNGKNYQGVVSSSDYDAPIELMRMFTTFGIKNFNHIELKDKYWHEQTPFRQDITELTPIFSGQELWIAMFIGNYDKGGHIVDLNFTIHEGEASFFKSKQVIPLFNTTNILEMAGQEYATMFSSSEGLIVNFSLDKPLKSGYLRYISTGHGGWEKGDEFLPKINTLYLDDVLLHKFIPWRQDCGSYRLFNPASGNFSNGLSSSDFSRSNWCPGMVTGPEFIYVGNLESGEHSIRVHIPMGENEGSSFSAWNVSGVLFGE